ncbi:MAG TPA: DUF805 domain-containing protein [Allosphingosinicella sp.]|nr:DUF805 domain-containing protein [Allosphingosinicella sp.]
MFLPLKRFAEFSGRSRRTEYWMFFLFQILLGVAFWVLLAIVGGGALMSGGDPTALAAAGGAIMIVTALYGLVSLALLIPAIAVTVRRLHDTNRTGKWLLALVGAYVVMLVGTMMAASSPDNPGLGGVLAMVGGIAALILAIVLLVFMFLEGTRGPNNYGPDPKGENLDQVFA